MTINNNQQGTNINFTSNSSVPTAKSNLEEPKKNGFFSNPWTVGIGTGLILLVVSLFIKA